MVCLWSQQLILIKFNELQKAFEIASENIGTYRKVK